MILAFDLIKDLSSLWKEIGSLIGLVLTGLVGYLIPIISKRSKSYFQQKFFMNSLKNSVEIKVKLAECKAKFDATRIYLYQFHNGKVFVGNLNFHKYSASAIFEHVSPGYSQEVQNQQSLPLDTFAEVLIFMFERNKDAAIIGNHTGCDVQFMRNRDLENLRYTMNSTSCVAIKMTNKYGAFVGLLMLWFDEEISRPKFVSLCKENKELDSLCRYLKNMM